MRPTHRRSAVLPRTGPPPEGAPRVIALLARCAPVHTRRILLPGLAIRSLTACSYCTCAHRCEVTAPPSPPPRGAGSSGPEQRWRGPGHPTVWSCTCTPSPRRSPGFRVVRSYPSEARRAGSLTRSLAVVASGATEPSRDAVRSLKRCKGARGVWSGGPARGRARDYERRLAALETAPASKRERTCCALMWIFEARTLLVNDPAICTHTLDSNAYARRDTPITPPACPGSLNLGVGGRRSRGKRSVTAVNPRRRNPDHGGHDGFRRGRARAVVQQEHQVRTRVPHPLPAQRRDVADELP